MDPDALHFRGRYRIPSTRRRGWDYADAGRYFVTVCTKGNYPWFGEIRKQIMGLSDIGSIAHNCWTSIPSHHPHVSLDRFVVMPNHVHGILQINAPVETPYRASLQSSATLENRDSRWHRGVLGAVINHFKGACSRLAHVCCPDFAWQPRFHDRIIRDEDELVRIRQYITSNPLAWEQDDLFIES